MTGAASLTAAAAQRAGAGYVRLLDAGSGRADDSDGPTEAVGVPTAGHGWADGRARRTSSGSAPSWSGPASAAGADAASACVRRRSRRPTCRWWSTATGSRALGADAQRSCARPAHRRC